MTQLCNEASSRAAPLSFSLTSSQTRRGLRSLCGISVAWYAQAPRGEDGFTGDCWFTYVPEYVRTRRERSGRNHAIVNAAAPPELPPIVARALGSRVNLTL